MRKRVPKENHKKRVTGITARWLRSTLFAILPVVVLFSIILFLTARSNYYTNAETQLTTKFSNSVESLFTSAYASSGEEGFQSAARTYVENFDSKDIMDVWVIDSDGSVIVSSSGFSVIDETMPDYKEALASDTHYAIYTGKDSSGESIKSATYIINNGTDNIGAVRYITSLHEANVQLIKVALGILALLAFMVLLTLTSGLFFISSIVTPVKEINDVTKRIAAGDMNARLPPQSGKDEIAELCESINHMADELNSTDKMKNDFISTVSHEMKTPLTAIKGWAETLNMGDTDPQLLKRGLDVITEEATRLTNVVNDLLDLSKIVNGRLTLKYEKIDVLAELDETIFLFRDRSMREGIALDYNAPHVPAPTEGDPGRIKQVFENILDNAFKYTQQGGTVTVAAEVVPPEQEGEKAKLKVYVEDTGCGISAAELPNVKKKFYKSNLSVKGSGIGLAVCDEIVRMNNGTLDIASEVGVGTCVTITLPVDYRPPEPALSEISQQEMENTSGENNS